MSQGEEMPHGMPHEALSPPPQSPSSQPSEDSRDDLLLRISELSEHGRLRALEDLVLKLAAQTGIRIRRWDTHRSFRELGVSGGRAMRLRRALSRHTGLTVSGSTLLDHPTPKALVRHFDTHLARGGAAPGASPDVPGTGRALPRSEDETIVVVGMACRYPGAVHSPDDLWRLVEEGTDATTPLPGNRGWDLTALTDTAGGGHNTTYCRGGGFLDEPGLFDAEFFGMSDAEARASDPQQRLVLETAWEAVEHARIDPTSLRSTPTGVFVGVAHQSYSPPLEREPEELEGHSLVGSISSSLSGRVAYALGLEGPALTVDTACSSALVGVHLAVQSLRAGESSLALAGGVSVHSTPGPFAAFSRQRGLAPDGRAKSFSADADGFALSEGAGLLLLERLSDARRHGHPVLAVIRGSAVNQDGTSNGMTAPNAPAQERLIRRALADARLRPDRVDVVEAHSPGTELGDPIEVRALQAVYSRDRDPRRPLLLGTMKSNIGHSLAAAGAGGIIKMVMAMRHGLVPRTLHVERPTPKVDWSSGTIRLLTEPTPWPETGEPRRAAVSSFGITGTNGHVILESPPSDGRRNPAAPGTPARTALPEAGDPTGFPAEGTAADGVPARRQDLPGLPIPWLLSARTAAGLRDQAARLRDHLALRPGPTDLDIGFSLATTRTRFEQRAVIVARERSALLRGLEALANDRCAPELHRSGADGPDGDGSCVLSLRPAGAALTAANVPHLNRAFPAFGAELREVCERAASEMGEPVDVDELLREPGPGDRATQPGTSSDSGAAAALRYLLSGLALLQLLECWEVRPDSVTAHPDVLPLAAHATGMLPLSDAVRMATAQAACREAGPQEKGPTAADHLTQLAAGLSPAPPWVPLHLEGGGPVTPSALRSPQAWLGAGAPAQFPSAPEGEVVAGTVLALHGHGREAQGWLHLLPQQAAAAVGEDRTRRLAGSLLRALAEYEVRVGGVDWGAVLAQREVRTVDLPTYAFQQRTFWAPFGTAHDGRQL